MQINFAEAQRTIDEAETDLVFLDNLEGPDLSAYRNLLTLAKSLMPQFGVRVTGRVRWYNEIEGYGFVTGAGSQDAFIHKKSLHEAGIETLREGDGIEYTLLETPKGLQARAIARVK